MLVDLPADSGTGGTTGGTAEQCAHQRASESAKERAYRPGDHAERCACFGTAERSGGTTGSTGNCTDCASNLAGAVERVNTRGVTAGTGKRVGHISAS